MPQNDPSNPIDSTLAADASAPQTALAPERTLCPFESFEYDAGEDAYRVQFDSDAVAPSTAVVSALAAISDTDPIEIEPLYAAVDPDVLDSIVSRQPPTGDVELAFPLHDHSVRVESTGCIEITPA